MEEKDLLQNSCGGFPYPVTTQGELESFSCGDKDLDDFFHQDAFLYAEQLLGKTYYFSTTGDDKKIVCAFTLANDSIKAALIPNTSRNRIQRKIPNSKRTRSYPAVLIGRLGVAKEFQGTVLSVGSQVIEYIASVQEFEAILFIKMKHISLIVSINNNETATSLIVRMNKPRCYVFNHL